MLSTNITGVTPFTYASHTSARARSGEAPAETASNDGFVATGSAQLGLIPTSLGTTSPVSTVKATNPRLLEAQSLSEQVSAAAVPGLGSLQAAKAGDKEEILAQFDRWNTAIKTRDPDKVLECYAPDAILLPTISNKVRHNHAEIKDYFEHFLAKGPQGKIDESNVRLFGDVAINSGVYTFSFANGDTVQARFTYVYRKLDGEWKIAEHHSSAMPEKTPHQARALALLGTH